MSEEIVGRDLFNIPADNGIGFPDGRLALHCYGRRYHYSSQQDHKLTEDPRAGRKAGCGSWNGWHWVANRLSTAIQPQFEGVRSGPGRFSRKRLNSHLPNLVCNAGMARAPSMLGRLVDVGDEWEGTMAEGSPAASKEPSEGLLLDFLPSDIDEREGDAVPISELIKAASSVASRTNAAAGPRRRPWEGQGVPIVEGTGPLVNYLEGDPLPSDQSD